MCAKVYMPRRIAKDLIFKFFGTKSKMTKTVFITGANRGIGFHLVKSILSRLKPQTLIATYRSEAKEFKEVAAANKNVVLLQMDITDYSKHSEAAQLVETVTAGAGLNLLINMAGISTKYKRLNQLEVDDLQTSMQVNFMAPVLLTKALLPQLEKASETFKSSPCGIGRAAVINVSSILGSISSNDTGGLYPYRCSKAALNAATKSMSVDLQKSKIIAVALHPGWVRTSMGGPKAPLSVEESVEGIVTVLENLNETNNGQFLQYDGKILPW